MDNNSFQNYVSKLQTILMQQNWDNVAQLAQALHAVWQNGNRVFLCGNGGSAANAMHIANDLLYGVATSDGVGMNAIALSSNSSIVTCLGNDLGYEHIFSHQLVVQGQSNDILIVLSGSGNSPNIINALLKAKELGMKTFAILGYSGGKCLELADVPIHFAIDDMQISEDLQLIVGHMIMQWFWNNPINK